MPITLTDASGAALAVTEESTLVITGVFKDEEDATVTPNEAPTWTLTNAAGTVINSRSAEPLDVSSSYTIVLTGDDLALTAGEAAGTLAYSPRRVAVVWLYDSDAGEDLHGTEEIRFRVAHLAGVPAAEAP
jgi:hypothetical protein